MPLENGVKRRTPGFRFELEALLRLRALEEDRAQARFFELLGNRRRLEEGLRRLVRARERAMAEVPAAGGGSGSALLAVADRRRCLDGMAARIGARRSEIESTGPALEEARAAFQAARARRRAVERLRERRLREFEQAAARREVRELDEIGRVQHVRRLAGGSVP